jgi:hypothetical protein
MLHVSHGNGGKDPYVPLPQPTLELLREYCVSSCYQQQADSNWKTGE